MSSFYSQDELEQLGFKKLGENVLISRKTSIYGQENISIGSNVRIDDFCLLTGNIEIGNYIHISAYSALFAGKTGICLEDFSGVSSRCAIYADTDDYSGKAMTNPTVSMELRNNISGKVYLKKYSIIGTGVTVMPGCVIGEGTAVGSMSLVREPLDEWSVYAGIPCRKIKDRYKDILQLEKEIKNDI